MNAKRISGVLAFLLAWLVADIFWNFALRGFTSHHASNPAVQGLANVT